MKKGMVLIMQKICKCGYETEKESFQFCPLCGKPLNTLELEEDGTYKAKRDACRVFDGWLDPNTIYYYKTSPIDDTLAWIYTSPISKHFIVGCHISKIRPLEIDRVEMCSFRKDGKCGRTGSCEMCLPKLKERYPHFEFCK